MELPQHFIRSIQNAPGLNIDLFSKVHVTGEQVTSVRLNPFKEISALDFGPEIAQHKVPWCGSGYYLSTRPSFTADPIFHAGGYYVQEASSMFLEQAFKQTVDTTASLRVLDLCAAPGGKTTLLQSIISQNSLLVSNEVIKSRVTVLAENVTKWGAANVVVTNNDAKDFQRLPNYFDVIVVDAPCSGSGLFRKDSDAVNEWSEQNVALCSQRQQRILADVLPALKPGGTLIYSTCSYSTEEDEEIADWLVDTFDMESVRLQTAAEWNITETVSNRKGAFGYRFYPDKLEGEGFFIAALKKAGDGGEHQSYSRKKIDKLPSKAVEVLKSFLTNAELFFFIQQNEDILAVPGDFDIDLSILQSALYIKKAGVNTGTIIRYDMIPDHCLAMSSIANAAIPRIEVSREDALQYLRKQAFEADTTVRGWALITYCKLPLGWVKILPNRINNYYPKDWRILNK